MKTEDRNEDVYYDPLRKKYVKRTRWVRRLRRLAAKHARTLVTEQVKFKIAGIVLRDEPKILALIKEWRKEARNG
jgi:hypothetical protein